MSEIQQKSPIHTGRPVDYLRKTLSDDESLMVEILTDTFEDRNVVILILDDVRFLNALNHPYCSSNNFYKLLPTFMKMRQDLVTRNFTVRGYNAIMELEYRADGKERISFDAENSVVHYEIFESEKPDISEEAFEKIILEHQQESLHLGLSLSKSQIRQTLNKPPYYKSTKYTFEVSQPYNFKLKMESKAESDIVFSEDYQSFEFKNVTFTRL